MRWTKKEKIGYKMVDGVKRELLLCSGFCLSTETKPVGGQLSTGSDIIEMDTSKVFFYNEDDEMWREF